LADNSPKPKDGSNAITIMCLRAARRLPFNAPCLSLRVNKKTRKEVIEEAAMALLSGGAHPILMNDDRLCPGLQQSAIRGKVSLKDSRDYACDGCYEPMLAGENWQRLNYLP
jgi:pyruvate-formate lyase